MSVFVLSCFFFFFFFNAPATTEIYTLSLHDALPISLDFVLLARHAVPTLSLPGFFGVHIPSRSEEHTSELQSRFDLVCRLLLEKKKKKKEIRREDHHKPFQLLRSHPESHRARTPFIS